eukprot:1986886-Rhodomonas_salina.1
MPASAASRRMLRCDTALPSSSHSTLPGTPIATAVLLSVPDAGLFFVPTAVLIVLMPHEKAQEHSQRVPHQSKHATGWAIPGMACSIAIHTPNVAGSSLKCWLKLHNTWHQPTRPQSS